MSDSITVTVTVPGPEGAVRVNELAAELWASAVNAEDEYSVPADTVPADAHIRYHGTRLEADLRTWFMRVSEGARRQAKLVAQMALKDGQAGRGPVQVSNRAIRSALGVHPGKMAGWARSIKKAQDSGFPPPYDEIDVSSGVQVFWIRPDVAEAINRMLDEAGSLI